MEKSNLWPAKDVGHWTATAVNHSNRLVTQVVYVSIVGLIMLAAFFEWFLWLAAFMYCLWKVYQKAENKSTKMLAVAMVIIFSLLRAVFLPIMIVTLPLPPQITRHFPHAAVDFLQWFAFWTFSGLLTIPWLLCIYQLVTHSLGRTKKIKHILDEIAAPKVVIVMPCYKELPVILLRTVDSLVNCEYPRACLHIFLSFDGDQEDELYLNTIEKLGVPLVRQSGYPTSIDVTYRETRVTVSRFPHGGKRNCQKRTFRLIDRIYAEYLKVNDNLFVLFIDSDCILDKVCIQNFMYEMELKPGSKHSMLAMTGVITSTTEKNTLITLLQDMEYIHGQLFERSVESGCGAVTCLPGALTILRFSAFRKLAKYYFSDKAEQCDDLFDYGKCHLGEDRWLTHLFMIAAEKPYQIGMSTGAFCKTEAVQTFRSLLKQRRRWFLGFITNEVCMLTDIRLWYKYPFLCLVRLGQNTIRTTALLFLIMVIALLTTSERIDELPVGFIAVSLGLNWVLMCCFAAILGRYKIMLYPLLFTLGPFLNWVYMVYGIFTAGQRTWGGPRADAGQADADTSPQAAIAHAEATGDDLNVVPETFRPAIEAKTLDQASRPRQVTLQPSELFANRFKSSWRDYSVWYPRSLSPQAFGRSATLPGHIPLHPRASWDSSITTSSVGPSLYLPRRVESFIDLETQYPPTRSRTHPPSAQSAFFESRREQARLSSQTLTVPSSQRASRAWNSSDESATDLVALSRSSLFHEELDAGASIPLMELRNARPTPENYSSMPATRIYEDLAARRGHSPLGQNPVATDHAEEDICVVDTPATTHRAELEDRSADGNVAMATLLGQEEAGRGAENSAKARGKKRLSLAETLATLRGSMRGRVARAG